MKRFYFPLRIQRMCFSEGTTTTANGNTKIDFIVSIPGNFLRYLLGLHTQLISGRAITQTGRD